MDVSREAEEMARRLPAVFAIIASLLSFVISVDLAPAGAATSLEVTPDGRVTWDPAPAGTDELTLRHQAVAPAQETLAPLIVGGASASIQDHRHAVQILGYAGATLVNRCGGVLVAPDWVLTVKHCWGSADSFTVIVGVTDWTDHELNPDVFTFESDTIVRQGLGVDLAMIELDRPVPSHVGLPLPVHPWRDLPDGTPASIVGWGVQDDGSRPDGLRRVESTVDADCGEWDSADTGFLEAGFDPDITLCTATSPIGACTGDSGSPVVVNDDGVIFLVGIVAFGSAEGCGVDASLPDAHVAVAAFVDWVEGVAGHGWAAVSLPVDATSFDLGELEAGSTHAVSLEIVGPIDSSVSMATVTVPGPGLRSIGEIGVDCADDQPHPFGDVASSSFAAASVGCIFQLGITTGTSPTTYSPAEPVTRDQMAAFVSRFVEVVTGDRCLGTHGFADVPPFSFAYEPVGCIFELGITTGTSPSTYAPADVVTREQMAAFVARAYRSLTGESCRIPSPFPDVAPSSFASSDVGCIASLGVTTGTSAITYSPADPVTREQMAAFVERLYRAVAV